MHSNRSLDGAAPVTGDKRIQALDILRGFAVLGILVMNIQSFSMLGAAYFNPDVSGYFEGIDRTLWIVGHLLTDQKFMALFSMMFGAGIILMSERMEATGRPTIGLHYRRMFWLLLIGAAHAYLLWYGDVLVWYALCGFVVFLFRKLRPTFLLLLGILGLLIGSLLYIGSGLSLPNMPDEVVEEMMGDWQPNPEQVEAEIDAYRGSFSEQLEKRVPTAFGMHTFVFLIFAAWRAGGLMFVGMAFFKWGILSATRTRQFYSRLALAGLVPGFALVAYGIYRTMQDGWTLEYSRFFGIQYNHWGSVLVSFGYIGIVMLWCQGSWLASFKARLVAVGRMALTNYLTQTILCTFLFYGHGLGWFQSKDRIAQTLVVLAVWTLQLIWSPIWLRHFRFGPFEWLWRSLTYWQIQPFRRHGP